MLNIVGFLIDIGVCDFMISWASSSLLHFELTKYYADEIDVHYKRLKRCLLRRVEFLLHHKVCFTYYCNAINYQGRQLMISRFGFCRQKYTDDKQLGIEIDVLDSCRNISSIYYVMWSLNEYCLYNEGVSVRYVKMV